jgi:hypothetical protein
MSGELIRKMNRPRVIDIYFDDLGLRHRASAVFVRLQSIGYKSPLGSQPFHPLESEPYPARP